MIDKLFPTTVSNILDYDIIKVAAERYVERICVEAVENYARNLLLQTMDADHIKEVAQHVSGDPTMSVEDLLDYINSENVYRECDFVSDLHNKFGSSVTYKLFEETHYYAHGGWYLPDYVEMTTGGTGKAGLVILEGNDDVYSFGPDGMSEIDKWLGDSGVAAKLPINLYIEIQNHITVEHGDEPAFDGTALDTSYPYCEDEVFVTNDPYYAIPEPSPGPEPPTPVEEWEDVTAPLIEIEFTVTGTNTTSPTITTDGNDEVDLSQYRVNPDAFDFEGAGYSLIELAKFIANNRLFDAYMSAAQVATVSYSTNSPGEACNFQFGGQSAFALGYLEIASWNYIDGLPLLYSADGETNWINGFKAVQIAAQYPYPNRSQRIARQNASEGMIDAIGGGSFEDSWWAVDEIYATGPSRTKVRDYITNTTNAFWLNPLTGDPIIVDFDALTSKLKFTFGNLDQRNSCMFAKGQICTKYKVKFRIHATDGNGHYLFQRYIGEGSPTVPVIPAKTILKGYIRSVGYQLQNKSVNGYTTNYLYGDGSSASLYGDNNKTYTLLGVYAVDGTTIAIDTAHMTLVESGGQYSLRLVWQAAAAFCYIVYSET